MITKKVYGFILIEILLIIVSTISSFGNGHSFLYYLLLYNVITLMMICMENKRLNK